MRFSDGHNPAERGLKRHPLVREKGQRHFFGLAHDHRPGSATTLPAVRASGRGSPLRESASPATSRIYAA